MSIFTKRVIPLEEPPRLLDKPTPTSATTVGRLVVMLHRSHENYIGRRNTLEEEIALRQEELRQINTAITSLGSALATATTYVALGSQRRRRPGPGMHHVGAWERHYDANHAMPGR